MMVMSKRDIDLEYLDMFSRQILVSKIGLEGQKKLFKSRVLVVGGGALGSAIAISMARLGVGFIRIVDPEFVEISNIPRTLAFDYNDHIERTPKAYAVAREIKRVSPYTEVDYRVDVFEVDNAIDLARDVDLILDGLDNMRTRFLVNEVAVTLNKPYVYAGVEGFYGVVMPVIPGKTACLRCIYSHASERDSRDICNVVGVSINTVMAVSSLATSIAMKILLGKEIEQKIYYIDLDSLEVRSFHAYRNPECPVCSKGLREFLGVTDVNKISRACNNANNYRFLLSKAVSRIDPSIVAEKRFRVSEDRFRYIIRRDEITIELFKNSRVGYVFNINKEDLLQDLIKEIERIAIEYKP